MYYQHLEEVDEEIKKSSQWLGMAGSKDSIEALIMDTSLWWKGRVKDWATIHKEQPCIHLLVLQVDQSRMERGNSILFRFAGATDKLMFVQGSLKNLLAMMWLYSKHFMTKDVSATWMVII